MTMGEHVCALTFKEVRQMDDKALLMIDGKTYELPILTGSEREKAIDISTLRQENGFITLDVGFANTGSCKSSITYMDGEKGILRYRGIPVEELAEKSTFVETAYLLINGRLPNRKELTAFSVMLNDNSLVHEDMHHFFDDAQFGTGKFTAFDLGVNRAIASKKVVHQHEHQLGVQHDQPGTAQRCHFDHA